MAFSKDTLDRTVLSHILDRYTNNYDIFTFDEMKKSNLKRGHGHETNINKNILSRRFSRSRRNINLKRE